MTNNKPPPKSPEDLMYDDVDDYNKMNFAKVAAHELEKVAEGSDPAILARELEKYKESFRNYYYASHVLMDSKNNEFFDEAVKDVYPNVKIKPPAKNLLRLVNKVYLQELVETCYEVMTKSGAEDVDQEVVEDAYRLMEKRKVKQNTFSKLFKSAH
jgi:hypothetical protein